MLKSKIFKMIFNKNSLKTYKINKRLFLISLNKILKKESKILLIIKIFKSIIKSNQFLMKINWIQNY